MDRSLLNNKMAITGRRLLQYSRRLRYLRPGSSKELGAGTMDMSLFRDLLNNGLAITGLHLLWYKPTALVLQVELTERVEGRNDGQILPQGSPRN